MHCCILARHISRSMPACRGPQLLPLPTSSALAANCAPAPATAPGSAAGAAAAGVAAAAAAREFR